MLPLKDSEDPPTKEIIFYNSCKNLPNLTPEPKNTDPTWDITPDYTMFKMLPNLTIPPEPSFTESSTLPTKKDNLMPIFLISSNTHGFSKLMTMTNLDTSMMLTSGEEIKKTSPPFPSENWINRFNKKLVIGSEDNPVWTWILNNSTFSSDTRKCSNG